MAFNISPIGGATDLLALLQQAISTPNSHLTSKHSTSVNPIAHDFNALAEALNSGDLPTAQQKFSQLKLDLKTEAQHQTQTQTYNNHGHIQSINSDLNALDFALSSGSLSQAQLAFTQLQHTLQTK